MPWRLPRWACITLPVAVTLKRFLAPDLVFNLGIWFSSGHNGKPPARAAWCSRMLARALNVLRFSKNEEIPAQDVATAALDQPGNEGCAYGREGGDWQRRTTNSGGLQPTLVRPG